MAFCRWTLDKQTILSHELLLHFQWFRLFTIICCFYSVHLLGRFPSNIWKMTARLKCCLNWHIDQHWTMSAGNKHWKLWRFIWKLRNFTGKSKFHWKLLTENWCWLNNKIIEWKLKILTEQWQVLYRPESHRWNDVISSYENMYNTKWKIIDNESSVCHCR